MNSRIKELRKTMNLTQEQFATIIGTNQQVISRIENNQMLVSDSLMQAIIKRLRIDLKWLIYGIETDDFNTDRDLLINKLRSDLINTVMSIDDAILSNLIYNISNLLQQKKDDGTCSNDNIEAILSSYKNELIAEKRGTTFLVSLNIKDTEKNSNSNLLPRSKLGGVSILIFYQL